MLFNAYRLEEVNISKLDTEDVTNMNGMFYNTYALFDLRGIRNLDTSKVTNMGGLFYNARSLTYLGGISNFDTSKVVYMNGMFESMHQLVGLDLSNFDTRNVRNMSTMFYNTNIAYLDLSSFKTNNLTHMNGTFAKMKNTMQINVNGWDVSNVTDRTHLFNESNLNLRVLCDQGGSSGSGSFFGKSCY